MGIQIHPYFINNSCHTEPRKGKKEHTLCINMKSNSVNEQEHPEPKKGMNQLVINHTALSREREKKGVSNERFKCEESESEGKGNENTHQDHGDTHMGSASSSS